MALCWLKEQFGAATSLTLRDVATAWREAKLHELHASFRQLDVLQAAHGRCFAGVQLRKRPGNVGFL
jgi:hypothetical protein